MIEVHDLCKSYDGFEAVRGVSFSAEAGGVVGLLGPNGAGKTTILRVLTGYHGPTSGSVRVAGFDASEEPLEIKKRIGYLPESVPLYADLTVEEYLGFVAEARNLSGRSGATSLHSAAELCGVRDVLSVPIEHLSKGYRQRVGLAQAVLGDPPILILDEPTTGLDPNQIVEMRTLIRALGERRTVILSTHILQEVEALCSDVVILSEGRLVARGAPGVIAQSLGGEDLLVVIVKAPSPQAVLLASARLRSGSLEGKPEALAAGTVRVRISCPPDSADDTAEAVSDWATDSGFKLLELRKERLSMEDIFVRITRDGAAP